MDGGSGPVSPRSRSVLWALLLTTVVAILPACAAGEPPCAVAPEPTVRTDALFEDVEAWVAAFVASIPTNPKQPYDPPEQCEQDGFKLAATNAHAGDLPGAARYLNPLGYDVYDFTDSSGRMAVFAEQRPDEDEPYEHGWGLYFIGIGDRPAPKLLVEAPHPLFDTDSDLVAARVFDVSGALYLGVAGTHRYVNGFKDDAEGCMGKIECADMSHQPKSVFQAMHAIALILALPGEPRVYQSHGYGDENHPDLAGAQAVSAALEEPTGLSRLVTQELKKADFKVCLVGDPAGEDCSDLRALKNVQAPTTRSINHGEFIHVEAANAARTNVDVRNRMAAAIAKAMVAPLPEDGI